MIVMGVPLALFPTGYMTNGSGFQGMLNHPQALGIFCGILGSYILIKALGSERVSISLWGMFVASILSLLLSQARTGFLAFAVGSAVGTIKLWHDGRGRSIALPALGVGVLLGSLVVVTQPGAIEVVEKFINKRDLQSVNAGAIWQETRAELAERSWEGFVESPIFGWGFGLPWSQNDVEVKYDPIFKLPISASVEKGLIVTATLEEVGLVGGLAALLFVGWIVGYAITKSRAEGAAIVMAALASNFGESTLTSFGGAGSFVWIAIAAGLSMEKRRG